LRQEAKAEGFALILPGLRYTCDKPLLYYTTQVLASHGFDVLQIWTDYASPEFEGLSQSEQFLWFLEDAKAALAAGQARDSYERLVLTGKSIGTLTMAFLLSQGPSIAQPITIWLTPLLNLSPVAEFTLGFESPALFAGGTQDSTFVPGVASQLKNKPNATTLIFEGANHSLEIPNDPLNSLRIMVEVIQGIADFIAHR
jgi:pimeloyl-ACP methyl ester carboxylesterase